MKKRTGILIAAVFAFTACGTSLYTTSSGQRFNDGIYPVSPEKKQYAAASVTASDTETENMIKKTKESEIYLFSQDENQQTKVDSILVTGNKSAVINFNNSNISSITVTDSPYNWTLSDWYDDWRFYSWAVSPLWWNPWYYGGYWGYYRPWRYYSSWYWDPWYWDPWWDPWYYGWGYPYGHYAWYHGWAPGYHHGNINIYIDSDRYYGPRSVTGSGAAVTSRTRAFSGTARSSSMSRATTGTSYSRGAVSRSSSSGLSAVRRTTASSGSISSSTARPSGSYVSPSTQTSRRRTVSTSNYRRPASAGNSYDYGSYSGSRSSSSRSSSYGRSSSSSYQRSTPSYYNRNSSYSTGRSSSYSTGRSSVSRSSGSVSRSSGSVSRGSGGSVSRRR